MTDRIAVAHRQTTETRIEVELNLDGAQNIEVQTGLGFFDHMLTALAFHAGWDLTLVATGDLHIDDHHIVEDCALTLGQAIADAAGDRSGIVRFGSKYAPLDESLSRCVLDFSGRPSATIDLGLRRPMIGNVAGENLSHFFHSLAVTGKFTIHLDVLRGDNDHHRAESAFKASALAFRESLSRKSRLGGRSDCIPSTKGTL